MFGLISKEKVIKEIESLMEDYKQIIVDGVKMDDKEMIVRGQLQYGVASRIRKEILEGDL